MADEFQAGTDTPAAEAAEAPAEQKKPATKPATKAAAKKTATKKAAAKKTTAKKAAAKKAAAPAEQLDLPVEAPAADAAAEVPAADPPAKKATAKKAATKRTTTRTTAAKKTAASPEPAAESAVGGEAPVEVPPAESAEPPQGDPVAPAAPAVLFQTPEPTVTTRTRRTRKTAQPEPAAEAPETPEVAAEGAATEDKPVAKKTAKKSAAKKTTKKSAAKKAEPVAESSPGEDAEQAEATEQAAAPSAEQADEQDATTAPETAEAGDVPAEDESGEDDSEGTGAGRRRRRRGGRRRRKSGDSGGESSEGGETADGDDAGSEQPEESAGEDGQGESSSSRRRRRRRRSSDDGGTEGNDDPGHTVTRVRSRRAVEDEITAISGSTRLEAKKQRRRDGREAGRRRAPIVSEAEFLARRESVDRQMIIRQREDLTQIAVLEDRVLVEHYVARESQTSLIGNVYLGRVQNVLPSMEAAFVDIGKGRNAVLYAGEVNWSSLGHKDGQPRKIESVLSSGQTVLVQVTKDPVGHKGARLTSQISLAGRFLVYVPDGTTSGISRKLPDTERTRLKALLKEIVPDSAGVIVRTAAEGASEEELTRDVERLKARWEDIEGKAKGSAPQLLYGEPDLTLKVVRDLFTEDFSKLVIQGDDAWETVQSYVEHVAPDLADRLERYEPGEHGRGGKADVFAEYRVEEQISKGLDRKVWLPSGGSLVIDRTEAMTVVDVNTGKFTGSGGNLEETVTKNNLEAAEEIVRQLRLRDIGGIIVVDFIDMVLESNRDLVVRRLVECLGRDRTRHQVAEVTSLGLVQMTRKRIGTGLLEAFSENCEHCQGRGLVIHDHPVEARRGGGEDDSRRGGGSSSRRGGRRGRGGDEQDQASGQDENQDKNQDKNKNKGREQGKGQAKDQAAEPPKPPSPKDVAAMAKPDPEHDREPAETAAETPVASGGPLVEPPTGSAAETPAAETPVAEATEAPTEPAKPKVSTRSRRRSATRPAGEPAVEQPAAQDAPVPAQTAEPAAVPAVVTPEQPAAPEPPKVVTRTRRRAATRPAGPPAEDPQDTTSLAPAGSVGEPSQDRAVEPGSADAEPGEGAAEEQPQVEHVPIKKKGTRKR